MFNINNVLGLSEVEYGDRYRDHVLDLYKTMVEMADNNSERRVRSNSFFLTLNTTIIGFIGYLSISMDPETMPQDPSFFALVAVAGMILSYLWYRTVRSYRDINSGKFMVINTIEEQLPLRPFKAEWIALGEGRDPKLYLEVTRLEMRIPWVFFILHLFVFIKTISQLGLG